MSDPTVLHCDIYIHQGEDFEGPPFLLKDLDTGGTADMTGWSARCEVRASYGGALITRFHSNGTWDGLITFSSAGNMTLALDDSKTKVLIPTTGGGAVYDVEVISPSGVIKRVVQGRAHVTPEVTTDA